MRVLHILYSGLPGGIERFVHDLFIAQSEQLETAIAMGNPAGPLWQEAQDNAWLAYDLKVARGWSLNPLVGIRAKKVFSGFDLLHFHYFHPELANAALRTGAKIVFTEHGMFDTERPGPVRWIKTRAKKRFLQNPRVRLVANSKHTNERLKTYYGVSGVVIPPGEFISEIKPLRPRREIRKDLGFSERDFVVAYCGRLAPVKRLDRMIRATEGLDVKLLFIGDGPERANLPDEAVITGFVDNPFDYIAASDLSIMPTRGESFGLSALESMALKVPVMCFEDGGGVKELLSGHPDLIAEDPDDMRNRIKGFMEDRQGLVYLGQCLRQEALKYDIGNITRAYELIYRRET